MVNVVFVANFDFAVVAAPFLSVVLTGYVGWRVTSCGIYFERMAATISDSLVTSNVFGISLLSLDGHL
jgi:hypothetical protein